MPNELSEIKKLAKALKLPAARAEITPDRYSWRKDGGYCDKLSAIYPAAEAAGFSEPETTEHESPDGNVVGRANMLVKGEWQLRVRSSYGVTKSDNNFSVELRRMPCTAARS